MIGKILFHPLISSLEYTQSVIVTLKGWYHESVSKLRYADVSLTTVRRERCFAISERNTTSPLVTSRISREGKDVTTYRNLPTSS